MANRILLSQVSHVTTINDVASWHFYFEWETVNHNVATSITTVNWSLRCEFTPSSKVTQYDLWSTVLDIFLSDETEERHQAPVSQTYSTSVTVLSGSFDTAQTEYRDYFLVKFLGANIDLPALLDVKTINVPYNKSYITVTLDPVKRYATLTHVADFTDEQIPWIDYTNPAGDYAISLQAGMSLSKVVNNMEIPFREINRTATRYTFNFTQAELNALREKLDDFSNNATPRVPIRVFLRTIVPDADGVIKTYDDFMDCYLTFVNYLPTASVSVKDTNPVSLRVTMDENIFVRYVSNVAFDLGAEAHKGAVLDESKCWMHNGETTINGLTGVFEGVEHDKFYAQITDSRGNFINYMFTQLNFIEYVPVTFTVYTSLIRPNGTATVTIRGKYFNGSFVGMDNYMNISYLLRQPNTSGNAWTHLEEVTPIIEEDNGFMYSFTLTGLEYTSPYELRISIHDAVKTYESKPLTIHPSSPLFDWDKNNFEFHIPVKIDGNTVPSLVGQGYFLEWYYRTWSDGTAELWRNMTVNTAIDSSTITNWYSSKELAETSVYYPFDFVELPTVTATLLPTGNTYAILFPSNTAATVSKTGTYQLNTISTAAVPAKNYIISFNVKGRWK